MKEAQKYIGFAAAFIFLILAMSMFLGDKTAEGFLMLVLLGILLYNIGPITDFFTSITKL